MPLGEPVDDTHKVCANSKSKSLLLHQNYVIFSRKSHQIIPELQVRFSRNAPAGTDAVFQWRLQAERASAQGLTDQQVGGGTGVCVRGRERVCVCVGICVGEGEFVCLSVYLSVCLWLYVRVSTYLYLLCTLQDINKRLLIYFCNFECSCKSNKHGNYP